MATDIYKTNLYEILGVSEEASEKQIVKGYRRKALKCHPDKNPDNPRAAELFHQLSKALEILTDAAARSAYDQSRRAKRAAAERNRVLNSKRKKFKEDLEARERSSCDSSLHEREIAESRFRAEIERLRKEGSRLLQQEQERMKQELLVHSSSKLFTEVKEEQVRIKLKWKCDEDPSRNGGYTQELLHSILSQYGEVSTLIVSSKRTGSALAEFENSSVSSLILNETGLKTNPFSIIWLSGRPAQTSSAPTTSVPVGASVREGRPTGHNSGSSKGNRVRADSCPSPVREGHPAGHNSGPSEVNHVHADTCLSSVSDRNYESLVLMKMRQMEERKRVIQQMKEEDEQDKM